MRVILAAAILMALTSGAFADNPTNAKLLAQKPADRLVNFGAAIKGGCVATKALYEGIGKSGDAKDRAFWSVRCANGKSYEVMIDPDVHGSTSILSCPDLQKFAHQTCFTKLP